MSGTVDNPFGPRRTSNAILAVLDEVGAERLLVSGTETFGDKSPQNLTTRNRPYVKDTILGFIQSK